MNMTMGTMPRDILILSDGKAGHLSQSRGLAQALSRLQGGGRIIEWPVQHLSGRGLWGQLPPDLRMLRSPLLIGAGSATHWPLLTLKKRLGGLAVVLMKPDLPLSWFDAVIAPRHDFAAQPDLPHLHLTIGVLNPFINQQQHQAGRQLILIGGPSKRHGWESQALSGQLAQLAARHQPTTLSTSRRTPADFMQLSLICQPPARWTIVPVAQTPPDFIATQLAAAESCWVTEDSISMIFESLTAGCQTGLLSMPRLRPDRITREIDRLIQTGQVMTLGHPYPSGVAPLREADQAAQWLLSILPPVKSG